MTTIYILYHYKIGKNDDELEIDPEELFDQEKLIGFFSDEAKAEETIRILQQKPGFRDWPDGFRIKFDELNTYAWEDGFISSDEA